MVFRRVHLGGRRAQRRRHTDEDASRWWYEGKRADLAQGPNRFRYIFHTCRILSCAKCSPVRESTKCRFLPRRHSTANVSSAARVFGSRTVVRSNPSACVWLAAQRTRIKSDKQSGIEQTDSRRSTNNKAVLATLAECPLLALSGHHARRTEYWGKGTLRNGRWPDLVLQSCSQASSRISFSCKRIVSPIAARLAKIAGQPNG
jgi:hypothetical protein